MEDTKYLHYALNLLDEIEKKLNEKRFFTEGGEGDCAVWTEDIFVIFSQSKEKIKKEINNALTAKSKEEKP